MRPDCIQPPGARWLEFVRYWTVSLGDHSIASEESKLTPLRGSRPGRPPAVNQADGPRILRSSLTENFRDGYGR